MGHPDHVFSLFPSSSLLLFICRLIERLGGRDGADEETVSLKVVISLPLLLFVIRAKLNFSCS